MKKFLYFCVMIFTSWNVMAQIAEGDNCYYPVINEIFTGRGRGWNDCFQENIAIPIWQASCPETPSGVTTDPKRHSQAFQPSHSIFNNDVFTDNKMRLVASYEYGPQNCNDPINGYIIPNCSWHNCNNPHQYIYYHSGIIQSVNRYGYGYYEVRCAMPVHQAVHASFWLWGGEQHHTYEEIDIMEYSKTDSQEDVYYGYSSGIWINLDTDTLNGNNIAKDYFHIPSSAPDIREMHTYGCEWLPDRVTFYRDGEIMKVYSNRDSIPHNTKWIKMSYAINKTEAIIDDYNNLIDNPWFGRDTLTVDYIKYYQLRTDCNHDITIQTQLQLEQLNTMKRSVILNNPFGMTLSSNVTKVVRAVDSIVIKGPFELQQGGKITLITHECPELSNTNL